MDKIPEIICITGGKGGTGKTFVAVNLATLLQQKGFNVLLVDGDVENPNSHLLLGAKLKNPTEVHFFNPKIIEEKCTKCGYCAENCRSNAFLHINGAVPIPMLSVCSGCKLCFKICPHDAIEEDSRLLGYTYLVNSNGIDLLLGELIPAEARSASLVKTLVSRLDDLMINNTKDYDYIVLDTAPGAHCDVEELISIANKVIPVTEPTKFGELDLLRIIELIELISRDYRIIINRSTLPGYKDEFLKILNGKHIPILGEIPLDEAVVHSYCQGIPLMLNGTNVNKSPAYNSIQTIFSRILRWCKIE